MSESDQITTEADTQKDYEFMTSCSAAYWRSWSVYGFIGINICMI